MDTLSHDTAGFSLQEKRKLLAQFLKSGSSGETSNLSVEQRRDRKSTRLNSSHI